MKISRIILILSMVVSAATAEAQKNLVTPPPGKKIFIPRELTDNDFTDPEATWSYDRMAYTDNVVVFWEKPFGKDPMQAPDLEGHNMKVDIDNLINKLDSFYVFFKDDLQFLRPHSKAETYRMMVMLNYSLEGTAYGGDYDGEIGALWIAPNRVQEKKLNCIAHELGHSFQSQISCDGQGEAWGGGGIFEMASQWMLWQVNPEWVKDENYHWEAFKKLTHKAFLDMENIYHSPYVLEYWSEKRGKQVIADLFRMGKKGEDPLQTYMRMFKLDLSQAADELFECYCKLVTFDFERVRDVCAPFSCQLLSPMNVLRNVFTPKNAPEAFGFNAFRLKKPSEGKTVKVTFEGLHEDGNPPMGANWKYGFVGVMYDGTPVYGESSDLSKGKISFKVPKYRPLTKDKKLKHLYFVVMGVPSVYQPMLMRNGANKKTVSYPYKLTVK